MGKIPAPDIKPASIAEDSCIGQITRNIMK
jgi:hypothetical protein